MTRRRFIADSFIGNSASLTGDQAAHLARVLRAEPGQIYDVVANGFLHRAEIISVAENEVVFTLHEELEADIALPVHMLLSVIKFDHYEWGIEKLTELGVDRITPVLARRTEKHLALASAKRVERWRRIALEASKQSRRTERPTIDDPQPLKEALAQVSAPHKLLLAETEQENTLAAALRARHLGAPNLASEIWKSNGPDAEHNRALALAIGPEGGWAPEEIMQLTASSFASVTLGTRILRAETAAIAALSICSALL